MQQASEYGGGTSLADAASLPTLTPQGDRRAVRDAAAAFRRAARQPDATSVDPADAFGP